jgi:hypothetical protein
MLDCECARLSNFFLNFTVVINLMVAEINLEPLHICNNFGHKASECRSKMLPIYKNDRK